MDMYNTSQKDPEELLLAVYKKFHGSKLEENVVLCLQCMLENDFSKAHSEFLKLSDEAKNQNETPESSVGSFSEQLNLQFPKLSSSYYQLHEEPLQGSSPEQLPVSQLPETSQEVPFVISTKPLQGLLSEPSLEQLTQPSSDLLLAKSLKPSQEQIICTSPVPQLIKNSEASFKMSIQPFEEQFSDSFQKLTPEILPEQEQHATCKEQGEDSSPDKALDTMLASSQHKRFSEPTIKTVQESLCDQLPSQELSLESAHGYLKGSFQDNTCYTMPEPTEQERMLKPSSDKSSLETLPEPLHEELPGQLSETSQKLSQGQFSKLSHNQVPEILFERQQGQLPELLLETSSDQLPEHWLGSSPELRLSKENSNLMLNSMSETSNNEQLLGHSLEVPLETSPEQYVEHISESLQETSPISLREQLPESATKHSVETSHTSSIVQLTSLIPILNSIQDSSQHEQLFGQLPDTLSERSPEPTQMRLQELSQHKTEELLLEPLQEQMVKSSQAREGNKSPEASHEQSLLPQPQTQPVQLPLAPLPPPPPPPPLPSPFTVGSICSAAAQTPPNRIKQIKWKVIPIHAFEERTDNIWCIIYEMKNPIDIDYKQLEDMFSQKNETETSVSDKRKPSTEASMKSFAFDIILMKKPADLIIQQIKSGNAKDVGVDCLSEVLKLLPSQNEVPKYDGDIDTIPPTEKFVYQLLEIPHIQLRMEMIILKETFFEQMEKVSQKVHDLSSVCTLLMSNESLKLFLRFILDVGNFMNKGSRFGNAFGFSILSYGMLLAIKKSNDTPTKEGTHIAEMTLLHYIVNEVKQKNKGALKFVEDFEPLQMTSSSKETLNEFAELKDNIKRLKSYLDMVEEDEKIFQDFDLEAANTVSKTEKSVNALDDQRVKLAEYFCESKQSFNLDDFLQGIRGFCEKIKSCEQDLKGSKSKAIRTFRTSKSDLSRSQRVRFYSTSEIHESANIENEIENNPLFRRKSTALKSD